MVDPAAIERVLTEQFDLTVVSVTRTRGGDINDAFRVETSDGSIFLKSSPGAQAGMFTAEAAGLEWLSENSAIATPDVVGVHDPVASKDGPRLLALEWIDEGSIDAEQLGRQLAAMHMLGAPELGFTPGPDSSAPMRFNDLSLPNNPKPTFAEFYAANRIVPLTERSASNGRLGTSAASAMLTLAERIDDFAGPVESPARTHGDLWIGNVIADREGTPILIDPVAHGGHREVDLANLTVFGGPGQRTFDAYNEAFPIADGFADRVPLWQLAMILLHVYLFGGAYESQAVSIANRYI
ncbi:MAG: fructosamine kinase family protein [Solirubrobacterales bacterium]